MKNEKELLKTENIIKKFGGLVAVNDVSIHVNKNEIVGLIGANGAGKTTLFNIIAGAFEATDGKVWFDENDITGKSNNRICELGLARTHQIVKPFRRMSVLENTMVGALLKYSSVTEAMKKSREVCDFLGIDHRINVLAADLNLPELKRLELARALATEPKIILLDEVMAGVNPSESAKLIKLVQKIRESGITVLLIEHVMKAVMALSDRIYVLNQGVLISEGSAQEVTEDPNVVKSYLGEKRYARS